MPVTGALRISPNNLHSPQCLELPLAEIPYTLGWGFFLCLEHRTGNQAISHPSPTFSPMSFMIAKSICSMS